MNTLLEKLIKGEKVTDSDLASELHNICDGVHSSCDPACPVHEMNNGIPWLQSSTGFALDCTTCQYYTRSIRNEDHFFGILS